MAPNLWGFCRILFGEKLPLSLSHGLMRPRKMKCAARWRRKRLWRRDVSSAITIFFSFQGSQQLSTGHFYGSKISSSRWNYTPDLYLCLNMGFSKRINTRKCWDLSVSTEGFHFQAPKAPPTLLIYLPSFDSLPPSRPLTRPRRTMHPFNLNTPQRHSGKRGYIARSDEQPAMLKWIRGEKQKINWSWMM